MKKVLAFIFTIMLCLCSVIVYAADITISFDANGGTATDSSITLASGETFDSENTPTRANYDFIGWAYSSEAPYTIKLQETEPSSSYTLYAKWVENKSNTYTITLDTNGGWYRDSQKVYVTTTKGVAPDMPGHPTRDGWNWGGWALDPEGKNIVDPETSTEEATYYAVWKSDSEEPDPSETITVLFDSNGGDTVPMQTITKGAIPEKPADPKATGLTFAGWYNGDSLYNFDTPLVTDTVLTAHWNGDSAELYTVTFIAGDASYGSKYRDGTQAKSYQLHSWAEMNVEEPIGTKHTKFGWWSKRKPSGPNDNNALSLDKTSILNSNETIYAVYVSEENPNIVEVTFNYSGGKLNGQTKLVKEVAVGGSIEEPEKPKRSGYKFKGWYYSSSDLSKDNKFDFSTPLFTDVQVYAGWEESDDEDDEEDSSTIVAQNYATPEQAAAVPNPEQLPVVQPVATQTGVDTSGAGTATALPRTGIPYDYHIIGALGLLLLAGATVLIIKIRRSK